MMPPPYHLRLNKAVDRFMLVDILRCFTKTELKKYRYLGLGGPFLEDIKLLDSFFPSLRTISFEANDQIFRRQKFNRPTRLVRLEYGDMITKIEEYSNGNNPLIVWYDSTQATNEIFDGFISLLGHVSNRSIVRVTMRIARREVPPEKKLMMSLTSALRTRISGLACAKAERLALEQDVERIVKEQIEDLTAQKSELDSISRYLPSNYKQLLNEENGLLRVLFKAIHRAVVEVFPSGCGRTFRLLNASYYSDNTKMLSVTGAVLSDFEEDIFMKRFKGTVFESAKWDSTPMEIDMPILTPKERLCLNAIMPVCRDPGKRLCKKLGFEIDTKPGKSESEMEMYNKYYRYYPMFAKVAL